MITIEKILKAYIPCFLLLLLLGCGKTLEHTVIPVTANTNTFKTQKDSLSAGRNLSSTLSGIIKINIAQNNSNGFTVNKNAVQNSRSEIIQPGSPASIKNITDLKLKKLKINKFEIIQNLNPEAASFNEIKSNKIKIQPQKLLTKRTERISNKVADSLGCNILNRDTIYRTSLVQLSLDYLLIPVPVSGINQSDTIIKTSGISSNESKQSGDDILSQETGTTDPRDGFQIISSEHIDKNKNAQIAVRIGYDNVLSRSIEGYFNSIGVIQIGENAAENATIMGLNNISNVTQIGYGNICYSEQIGNNNSLNIYQYCH